MQALILAAGYGTRMGSLSQDKPKHLLEIKDKMPVIEFVVKNIAESRYIDKIFIITNGKFYNQFKDWLINVKKEQRITKPIILINNNTLNNEERLGSVGDILYGLNEIRKTTKVNELLVAQGDDLVYGLSIDNFIEEYKKDLLSTIIVHRTKVEELAERFGVIETDENNKIIQVREKPKLQEIKTKDGTGLANGGYYIFTKKDLEQIEIYKKVTIKNEKKPLDKTGKLFAWLIKQNIILSAYEYPKKFWWDVGKPEDLESAKKFYQNI